MYSLRYQRFRLFDFLLNEITADLNLRSKDQQGNTILHYTIIYANDNTEILQKLLEKFKKFGITPDDRNIFGFTPLLLGKIEYQRILIAVYCIYSDLLWTI
jgi:ankyrin repeat protein